MKGFRHSILIALAAGCGSLTISAEAPEGYYSSCEGKCGAQLLSALCDVIGPHTNVGYDGLWEVYETSDIRDDGTVWDMYSTKHWVVGAQHCGNYSVVGDCINREHSFPKSWFSKASPMVADGYHVYPTDGKVNGQRSNFPYGECANGTTLASNGNVQALGKLGTSTFEGYSGKVFEPVDEYKGDLARSYFYMAACYNGKIANWSSDMLAGNAYPAFSSWAVELLMKWHRLDPVSGKETVRNDEVAKFQKNRNPFIDYPELAEHIWGAKKNIPWSASAAAEPTITAPVNGTSIDLGVTATSRPLSHTFTVMGGALDEDVTVSVSGSGFSVTPSTLTSASVCGSGAALTLTYNSATAATATGTLTLTSGTAKSTVNLKARAMDGIPVGDATNVSDQSFTVSWLNIHDASALYTLSVWNNGALLPDYPVTVAAADQTYTVTDLNPVTTYTYQIACGSITSQTMTVTTGEPVASIQFLYDGELYFTAQPGVPSEVAEVLLDIENIDSEITISCTAPFQVSTDKASWGNSVRLSAEEDRFYMRVYSDTEGEFTTTLSASADDYENDVDVKATVGNVVSLYEDFEGPSSGLGNYSGGVYTGSQMTWQLTNAGIYAGNSEPYHSENQSVRFGKASAVSSVEMLSDKSNGIGTCSFWVRKWGTDSPSTVEVQVSTDGGASWNKAGEATFAKNSEWEQALIDVNVTGAARIRLWRGTEGGRLNLDDIELTDFAGVGAVNQSIEYHSWDAFCRDGQLVIENASTPALFRVYSIDGTLMDESCISGSRAIALPAGLYLVNTPTFTRRVLVK